MRKSLFTAAVLSLAATAPNTYAHEAGDILVRAGVVTVTSNESTSGVVVDRSADLGGKATLNNNTQLGLNFAYMLSAKVGIELLAATPFEHKVAIAGTNAVDGSLGSVKHLPPTLSAVYYPLNSTAALQPYAGLGINYTWFFDEKMTANGKANGLDNLKIQNSWGWAAQIGADYMLSDNLMLNGQVRYIDIDTEARVDVGATSSAKVDVNIKPIVYMLGVGYKF